MSWWQALLCRYQIQELLVKATHAPVLCSSGPSDAGAHPGPIAEQQHEELHSPIDVLCRALRHPGSDLRVLR